MFFERNEKGVPTRWVDMMKKSIKSNTYRYSTHRMVQDYTNEYYVTSMNRHDKITTSNHQFALGLADWKQRITNQWPQVQIVADKTSTYLTEKNFISGESIPIDALVNLGDVDPSSVKVQIYYGNIKNNDTIENAKIADMELKERNSNGTYRYSTNIALYEGGEYGYTFRVIPSHPDLINVFNTGLIRWVVQ